MDQYSVTVSGRRIGHVAGQTAPGRAMRQAIGLSLHVAGTAQGVKLRFEQMPDSRGMLMTVEAQPVAAVVRKVVMAADAVDLAMIEVRER